MMGKFFLSITKVYHPSNIPRNTHALILAKERNLHLKLIKIHQKMPGMLKIESPQVLVLRQRLVLTFIGYGARTMCYIQVLVCPL